MRQSANRARRTAGAAAVALAVLLALTAERAPGGRRDPIPAKAAVAARKETR